MRPLSVLARALGAAHRSLPPKERRVIVAFVTVVLAGSIWGTVSFIAQWTVGVPRAGGVYREGIVIGQPRRVTPILAQTNDVDMGLSRLIYSGLLKLAPDGTLTGDLAERVDVSDDGKVYSARLRQGVRWHDGEPFSAKDVVFTFRTIQNPDTKSPSAQSFQGVVVEETDDRTVTFTLREPYAPFLYNLTTGIVPEHVWASVEPQNMSLAEANLKPIGTGAFQFKKSRKRSLGEIVDYELVRYDGYHGERPYLDGVTFVFFSSNEDLLRAFRRRNIDAMNLVSPSLIPEVQRVRGAEIRRVKLPQYFAVFLNDTKNPILADHVVRAALDLATDRERLIAEALHGEGVRADAPIPAGFLGHVSAIRTATFDVEKAKQNLEEAGWKDTDGDGLRQKEDRKLQFTIVTTDVPEYARTAELLAEGWRAIGADVAVETKSVGTVQADVIRPRNYDALLYGEVLGADPDPYPFWHSTQTRDPGVNLALYKDRAADKLLEEARKTTDTQARSAIYQKFQEQLIEDLPAIFLYSPLYTYATRGTLRGTMLEALPLPSERFTTVSSWYMRTKRVWK